VEIETCAPDLWISEQAHAFNAKVRENRMSPTKNPADTGISLDGEYGDL
jgi:hypothetical protein